tara:strand:- start:116 stop:670 length:555 start_codon:yes stop_codon:yes gene_type:complete
MNNSKTNVSIIQKPIIISFIGMMASGKTKIGKKVSKHFNFTFYDIDEIIEKKYKMTVTKIFKNLGEKTFREEERFVIKNKIKSIILNNENAIVSLGGGGFDNTDTRKFLLNSSFVIWLDCPVEILINRIGDTKNRPMLRGNISQSLSKLMEKRKKYYNKAHIKFDTSIYSSKQIIMKIKEKLNV